MQNVSSVGIFTQCIHVRVARLAPTCMLSRCLLTKISASELSRKFIKSCIVGWVGLSEKKEIRKWICKKKLTLRHENGQMERKDDVMNPIPSFPQHHKKVADVTFFFYFFAVFSPICDRRRHFVIPIKWRCQSRAHFLMISPLFPQSFWHREKK